MINFVAARNPEREMEMGLFRISIPEFDHRAVREAIVNAFAHRGLYPPWQSASENG